MSIVVHVASDGGIRAPLGRARVERLVRHVARGVGVRDALISVAFVPLATMVGLNWRHLRRRGPTDVIAFGFTRRTAADPVVGDIYIAPDVARRNAAERRLGIREEAARLVVHGVLHVVGFDHPEHDRERSSMWRRQEQLLASATLANRAVERKH